MNSDIEQALLYIQADDRDLWVKVGMAIKSELGDAGFDIWDAWSQSAGSYKERDARSVWKSIKHGSVQIGTLFHIAMEHGYQPEKRVDDHDYLKLVQERKQDAEKSRLKGEASLLLERAETRKRAEYTSGLMTPAPTNHAYLVRKGIEPLGVGVLGCEYKYLPRMIRNKGNVLVVPKMNEFGEVRSIEFIGEDGTKATLAGSAPSGLMYPFGEVKGVLWIAEGFATAATVYQEKRCATFASFSSGNLMAVAVALRHKYPDALINFMADPDDIGVRKATSAAHAVGGHAFLPNTERKDLDYNDYIQERRHEG